MSGKLLFTRPLFGQAVFDSGTKVQNCMVTDRKGDFLNIGNLR